MKKVLLGVLLLSSLAFGKYERRYGFEPINKDKPVVITEEKVFIFVKSLYKRSGIFYTRLTSDEVEAKARFSYDGETKLVHLDLFKESKHVGAFCFTDLVDLINIVEYMKANNLNSYDISVLETVLELGEKQTKKHRMKIRNQTATFGL